jgi:predicted amidohydrolase
VSAVVRVALESDTDWRAAIRRGRERGADLVCLPHVSFAPYVARDRDRAGFELAERAPSLTLREAVERANGGWVAASAYESEGEGVFYMTAYVAGPEAGVRSGRQRCLEASTGRYEQMFWSPGHEPLAAAELPGGRVVNLLGADLRAPSAWAEAAALGSACVVGGASESTDGWAGTCRVVAGMAAVHGLSALVVNRSDDGFAGGSAAFAPDGSELEPDADGLYDV